MMHQILKTTSFRLTAIAVCVLTGSIVILGLFFLYSIRQSMYRELTFRVQQEAEVLLLDYKEDGLNELLHDVRERRDAQKANRLFYFLENKDGKVIFDDIDHIPSSAGWHEVTLENGTDALLYSVPLTEGYVLAVSASLENFQAVQRSLMKALFSAIILTIVVGIGSGLFLSRRFLSRIDQVRREAARIGSGNLSERLTRDGSGDDFDQLASTINEMLERIEALVRSVKRVSSNVAHELRTPIGHVKQDLEKLLKVSPEESEARVIVDETLSRIDGILEIFAALLRVSELEAGELKAHFKNVPLGALLNELTEIYQPVAETNSQTLTLILEEELFCQGDRRLLLQLFSNLLENALRHAGSGVTVEIRLSEEEATTRVTVADTGSGMSEKMQEEARRKLSDAETLASAHLSKGVGLVLVGAIARLHSASVSVENKSPGLTVKVEFPKTSVNARHT